jgi:hypothetical protein
VESNLHSEHTRKPVSLSQSSVIHLVWNQIWQKLHLIISLTIWESLQMQSVMLVSVEDFFFDFLPFFPFCPFGLSTTVVPVLLYCSNLRRRYQSF